MFGMNLDNLDDPKKQMFLQAALGLLGGGRGHKNFGADLAHGLQQGLLGYAGAQQAKSRSAEEAQQREMREMQMQQMRQAQQREEQMRALAARSFAPAQALDPRQQEGGQQEIPGGGGMQEFARGMMGIDPMVGMQFMPKPEKPRMAFATDGRAVDMNALTPGESFAKQPDWKDPQYEEVQARIRAAGRPQVSVNTNMPPLERKEQQSMGELHVKNYGDLQASAGVARRENALLSGLEKIPVETGKLTPANATVAAWLKGLGANSETLKRVAAGGEAFTALSKELVLQRQLAQKGPQTESDARRLEQTVANLANTPEANKVILGFNKAVNNRIIEQEKFYNDWWTKNKTMQGADNAWINGKGGKSIWDEPALKKFLKNDEISFDQLPRAR
jgi:hypothetical protein